MQLIDFFNIESIHGHNIADQVERTGPKIYAINIDIIKIMLCMTEGGTSEGEGWIEKT